MLISTTTIIFLTFDASHCVHFKDCGKCGCFCFAKEKCLIRRCVCAKNLLLSTQQNPDNKTRTTNISDSRSSYSNITKITVSITLIIQLQSPCTHHMHFHSNTPLPTQVDLKRYSRSKKKKKKIKHTHTQLCYMGPLFDLSLCSVANCQSSP